ncbi:hypothetical protein Fmac_032971 [Flemingia macrophylla]|uniref:Uncharacterized protein n=1 Tax=Flemingia macrophylla TaxID=520843 RepID=A0ABD1L6F9_9FABA
MEIFQPLVLEEFKAQLHNSFLEMSSWEMFFGILFVMSIERIDDFHLVRFVQDDGDSAKCRVFSENDFLLLTKEHPQKSSRDIHMVGKVGDPKQLPATVLSLLSYVASKFLYECSMFERLQKAGHPVIVLTEQYRMHPEICKFRSLHFYDNKLLNGSQMSNKSAPFHQTKGLGPYVLSLMARRFVGKTLV